MTREYLLLEEYYFYVIFLLKIVSLCTRKIKDGCIHITKPINFHCAIYNIILKNV